MGKRFLKKGKDVAGTVAYIDEAEAWAKDLVDAECRFPGDYGPAMRRVAAKASVPFTLLWRLHYKKPKTIDVDKYVALGEFYGRNFSGDSSQRGKYRKERREVAAKTAFGRYLLRTADRLVGEDDEAVK